MISLNKVAELCHEANKAWCEINEDNSQPSWAEALGWQKESAINGVLFHMANPDAGDSASHDNWMAEKVANGWVYGEIKDQEAKTHPCIVSFDELPVYQQKKDAIFRSIVHVFLNDLIAQSEAENNERMHQS